VLARSGGAVRSVPPWVKLGVHAIGIDLQKTSTRGAPLAAAITQANSRIVEYLHEMGISKGLFDASDAVPHESHRFLKRDELVLFRVDTRSFGETSWWLMRKPTVAIAKGFFARTGKQEPAYPNALLRLSCGAGKSMRLTFTREPIPNLPLGAGPLRLDVNVLRMDLPFGMSAGIETRTVPLLQNVVDSLDDALSVLGNVDVTVAREMTKLHEEFVHGTIRSCSRHPVLNEWSDATQAENQRTLAFSGASRMRWQRP